MAGKIAVYQECHGYASGMNRCGKVTGKSFTVPFLPPVFLLFFSLSSHFSFLLLLFSYAFFSVFSMVPAAAAGRRSCFIYSSMAATENTPPTIQ